MHNGPVTDDRFVPAPTGSGPASLRPGTVADVEGVLGFWAAAGARPTTTDDAAAVRGLMARDPEALLIAEIDGRMVGTLVATWDGWRGNMYRLAVHPDVRRRGIAAALVRRGEARLRALGCRRVSALVVGDDDVAHDFWRGVDYLPHPMDRHVHTLA
jgi:ribosomal protein S18 acetylase RimI-like enzyme